MTYGRYVATRLIILLRSVCLSVCLGGNVWTIKAENFTLSIGQIFV